MCMAGLAMATVRAARPRRAGWSGRPATSSGAPRRSRPRPGRPHRRRLGPRGPAPRRQHQRARSSTGRGPRSAPPSRSPRPTRSAWPPSAGTAPGCSSRGLASSLGPVATTRPTWTRSRRRSSGSPATGIYSIIDFHQDAWGPTLAARPGEDCPPDVPPALGWDGAPGWATLDGGAPRCALGGIRELSPAVRAAFAAFWDDAPGPGGVGIRTRYVRMLGHVAGRFARWPAVAGYDVMNEPNAFGPEAAAGPVGPVRPVVARRPASRARRRRLHRHLLFFEPSTCGRTRAAGVPPAFAHDRDVVYAPHLYTGGFTGGPITADAFQRGPRRRRSASAARRSCPASGAAIPSGPAPTGDTYFLDHQRLQDDFQFGATLWTWRESCGDPHKAGDVRAGRVPTVWGEFDVDCRTNSITGVRHDLVRPVVDGRTCAPLQVASVAPRSTRRRVASRRPGPRRAVASASRCSSRRDRRTSPSRRLGCAMCTFRLRLTEPRC